MSIPSWSTRAASSPMLLRALNIVIETSEHATDANRHYAWNRVRAEWARPSVDESTAIWQAMTYRGETVARRTAAGSTGYLLTNGAPLAGASSVLIDGLSADVLTAGVAGTWYKGWHFMIWDDPTVYTLSADVTPGGYETIIEIGTDPRFNALDLTNGKLYYGDNGGTFHLRYCNLDGTSDALVRTGAAGINGIAVDPVAGKVYFAEGVKLQKCDLDGSNLVTLLTNPASIRGVAHDATNGHIYYTMAATGIQRCNDDGTSDGAIIGLTGTDDFWDIALDVTGNKMYFIDYGDGTIERATLAGASQVSLFTGLTTNIGYIAIDVTGGFLYWVVLTDGVYRAAIDGTGAATKLFTSTASKGISLDQANDHIYYTKVGGTPGQYRTGMGGYLGAYVPVTPTISAAAAALGDNAPVHFFIPQESTGAYVGHVKQYAPSLTEEFTTSHVDVYQPEP